MRKNIDKRAKKVQAKKKKEPETFEEFMDEAIHNEEQGERYQTGEKAQRNYERAAEMYGKAYTANPKDADCVYNWGRVLFLLVNFLPSNATAEDKLAKVDQSIEKFRIALDLEANKTDAQFNLAQALHQRSEILQETTQVENAYAASAVALQEAIALFESVYDLQEKEYAELNLAATDDDDASSESNTHEKPSTAAAAATEEEFTTVTKVEPTTAHSLVETLLSTAETMTTMASLLASYPASMDLFNRAKSKLAAAEKWYSRMSNDSCTNENADAEKLKKAARIQINLKQSAMYAARADRSFLATGTVDSTAYENSINQLDDIVNIYDEQNVEALCDRGDVLSSFGQAIREAADKKKTALDPEKDGKEVWNLYADAIKSFQKAIDLEPTNTHILNKMGDLSLTRAALGLPVAKRNQQQLLANAKFYYNKAVQVNKALLTSGYLGWAMAEWALEEWANVPDKKKDAIKIMNAWIRKGGDGDLFRNLADDQDVLDEDFVDFVLESCFADEED